MRYPHPGGPRVVFAVNKTPIRVYNAQVLEPPPPPGEAPGYPAPGTTATPLQPIELLKPYNFILRRDKPVQKKTKSPYNLIKHLKTPERAFLYKIWVLKNIFENRCFSTPLF